MATTTVYFVLGRPIKWIPVVTAKHSPLQSASDRRLCYHAECQAPNLIYQEQSSSGLLRTCFHASVGRPSTLPVSSLSPDPQNHTQDRPGSHSGNPHNAVVAHGAAVISLPAFIVWCIKKKNITRLHLQCRYTVSPCCMWLFFEP